MYVSYLYNIVLLILTNLSNEALTILKITEWDTLTMHCMYMGEGLEWEWTFSVERGDCEIN